ncbi:hypothetical protein SPI_08988 [Niveomyces insectorum RCEF 264]|uniref:Uncharacterized protein n=1 Tax=Niveomyces insectorum RCEF 264 TaxID=1081102 RepID=A0A167MHP4_9HYPO|nr:hypothetical protein SPI_08988 [Niveomyces insectorum RCEF 264]
MAYIGKNQGSQCVFVVRGDFGNGLTHGVIAGRVIADEICGVANPWTKLYSPKRIAPVMKAAGSIVAHDIEINTQYKRFLVTDIKISKNWRLARMACSTQRRARPWPCIGTKKARSHRRVYYVRILEASFAGTPSRNRSTAVYTAAAFPIMACALWVRRC